jgi:hypothetical protein
MTSVSGIYIQTEEQLGLEMRILNLLSILEVSK